MIAQALHHGSAHREQVCAMVREFGLEPPELQPWDFADATGRSRWLKADQSREPESRRVKEGGAAFGDDQRGCKRWAAVFKTVCGCWISDRLT